MEGQKRPAATRPSDAFGDGVLSILAQAEEEGEHHKFDHALLDATANPAQDGVALRQAQGGGQARAKRLI